MTAAVVPQAAPTNENGGMSRKYRPTAMRGADHGERRQQPHPLRHVHPHREQGVAAGRDGGERERGDCCGRIPVAFGHEHVEDGEDPGRDGHCEKAGRHEVVVGAAGDHLGMAAAAQPRVVPRRPPHAKGEHGDHDHLAVAGGHAVEAGIGEPVEVLDEEAIEQVQRVEGEAADDPGPRKRDHLARDAPVDPARQVANVLAKRDDEGDAHRAEGGDQDALDAELPDGDEQDAHQDLGSAARQRVRGERLRCLRSRVRFIGRSTMFVR